MNDANIFLLALGRLKEQIGLSKDKEVAEALGLGEKAFNARKARASFPEREVLALATSRPELALDVTYILTGERVSALTREQLAITAGVVAQMGDAGLTAKMLAAHKKQGVLESNFKLHLQVLSQCATEDVKLVMRLAERLAPKVGER